MTDDIKLKELRRIQALLGTEKREKIYNRLKTFLRTPITDPYHYYCAATITYRLGFYQHTIDLLENSFNISKTNAEPYHLLSHAHLQLDRYNDAEEAVLNAISINPDNLQYQITHADICTQAGKYQEAENRYLQILGNSGNIDILYKLGFLYERSQQNNKALDITRRILAQQPEHLYAKLTQCRILCRIGELEKAEEILNKIVTNNPNFGDAWFDLGRLKQRLHKYSEAYDCFSKGNQLTDRKDIDPCQAEEEFSRYMRNIGQIKTQAEAIEPSQFPPPVFIVGLPRSGTTLLSNMLDQHPSLDSVGEIPFIRDLYGTAKLKLSALHLCEINSVVSISYGIWMDMNEMDSAALHKQFERDLESYTIDPKVSIVDKTPSNVLHLPMIALVSPKSPIIHIIRDGREASWSNFTQNFSHYHWFSHSLENCMKTWQRNIILARKCAEVFKLRYLEVRYEDLVTSPRETLGKILNFMGLAWEERCLTDYQKSSKPVLTASYEQVNKPLYTSSLHQARNYPEAYAEMTEIGRDLLEELGYLQPD